MGQRDLERLLNNGSPKPAVRVPVQVNGQTFYTWPELAPFFILLADVDTTLGQIRDELKRRPFVPAAEEAG